MNCHLEEMRKLRNEIEMVVREGRQDMALLVLTNILSIMEEAIDKIEKEGKKHE